MKKLCLSIAALTLPAIALAQTEGAEAPAPSPNQIVEQASAKEWVAIPAEDLLVMTLAADRDGNPREVVIQLMPAPFSLGWVENVRLLTRSGYYDGLAVIRVQDNYVTQWGDPDADSESAKPLPDGLNVVSEDCYVTHFAEEDCQFSDTSSQPNDDVAEADNSNAQPIVLRPVNRLQSWQQNGDAYQATPDFLDGWPVASGFGPSVRFETWPVHCYGMVGVARDLSPNTGDGSSLYTVIGHAPRHLDRNIALVGRVIEGMEHMSSLPRGKGDLGFYEDKAEQTPILSVKVASDIEQFPQSNFQYLSTESETFARYAEARANRRDPFFIQPAGGADICNIPVPVRRVPGD